MLKTDLYGLPLYTAQQSRDLDRIAIEQFGIPGFTLMRRAGRAAFRLLLQHWSYQQSITIFAGHGNNGGDGFIIAALAKQYGIQTTVYFLGDKNRLDGDVRLAYDEAVQADVRILPFSESIQLTDGLVVDAMLGTGLGGNVRGAYADAVALINGCDLPVLAVDIPSGLCSDSGIPLGDAVQADYTITFIGLKQGLMTGAGPQYCGKVVLHELELPDSVYGRVMPSAHVTDLQELHALLQTRRRDAHKGLYGHVLIIGGDYGMAGAVAMAGEAAARVGAGLVSVVTQPEHVPAVIARRPEIMVHGVVSGQELEPLLDSPTVIVIGPGLGRRPWADQMLQKAYKAGKPLVVDADALNLLAERSVVTEPRRDDWILTPHPGEAARLLDCSTADIQAQRFSAGRRMQEQYGGVAVLKGAGSVITNSAGVCVCNAGNPGMASGGMGDVLSGVIGGLVAQGINLPKAASLGTTLHAMAGDLAATGSGQRGLLATDLMMPLRRLVNGELD